MISVPGSDRCFGMRVAAVFTCRCGGRKHYYTLLRLFEYPIPETDNPPRIHFHDYNSKIGAPKVVLYSKMFLVSQPLDQHVESLCMPT